MITALGDDDTAMMRMIVMRMMVVVPESLFNVLIMRLDFALSLVSMVQRLSAQPDLPKRAHAKGLDGAFSITGFLWYMC